MQPFTLFRRLQKSGHPDRTEVHTYILYQNIALQVLLEPLMLPKGIISSRLTRRSQRVIGISGRAGAGVGPGGALFPDDCELAHGAMAVAVSDGSHVGAARQVCEAHLSLATGDGSR